jgi:hypothetical protein
VFADAVSVCAVGESAVHAIRELEVGGEREQLRRDVPGYPPRVVRHALLGCMAAELVGAARPALDVAPGAPELEQLRAAAAVDLARLPALAEGILRTPLDDLGTLPHLFGWGDAFEARDGDRRRFRAAVAGWRRGLLGEADLGPIPSTEEPRRLISASMEAWRAVALMPDAGDRENARDAVAGRLLEVLPDCREDLTREAATAELPDAGALGEELSNALLRRLPAGSLA